MAAEVCSYCMKEGHWRPDCPELQPVAVSAGYRAENIVVVDNDKDVKHVEIDDLVNKFLVWPLPDSVCSDCCTTVPGYPHRVGTHLLTATEAKQMFEYLFKR